MGRVTRLIVMAVCLLVVNAIPALSQGNPSGISLTFGDAGGFTYWSGCGIGLFHGWLIAGTNAATGPILNAVPPFPGACGSPEAPLNLGTSTFSILGQECGFNQFNIFDLPAVTQLGAKFSDGSGTVDMLASTGSGNNVPGAPVAAFLSGKKITLSNVFHYQLGFLRAGRYYADLRGDNFNVASCGNGWPLANFVTRFDVTVETLDSTKPVIAASASTASGPYSAGNWTKEDVTVSFTCSDEPGGSGLAANTVAGTTVGASTESVTNTGTCVDNAGNVANPASFGPINIDKTAPAITYSGNAGTYTVDQTVSITCTASDTGSGVASQNCANISGNAYSFGLGAHSYSASAMDAAGNTGSGSTTFTVVVNGASLSNLIDQLGIDPSIAGSLKDHVNSIATAPNANAKQGKLNAFRNFISAQRGKKLTNAQADLLLTLAAAL